MSLTKTTFKSKALEYFRKVQSDKEPVIILERGKPVLKIIPYSENPRAELEKFRDSIRNYKDPLEPVASDEWEAMK